MRLFPNIAPIWQVILGNSIELLKSLPDNSVDAVVCDPPYGLSEHTPEEVMEAIRCWIEGRPYTTNKKGFMGNAWDAFPPGPEFWKEVLRVLKPGGFLLAFAGERTQDLMGMAIRLAGFEIRDVAKWIYGSGFPKSHNLGNEVDKRIYGKENRGRAVPTASTHLPNGKYAEEKLTSNKVSSFKGTSEAAKELEGYGTALKPATEPIIMARKPLGDILARNVVQYRVGGLNIDGCRVPVSAEEPDLMIHSRSPEASKKENRPVYGEYGSMDTHQTDGQAKGRWPANLLISHSPDCKITGYEEVTGYQINRFDEGAKPFGGAVGEAYTSSEIKGGKMPVYACVPGCPAQHMKEQVASEAPPKKSRNGQTVVNASSDPARYFNQFNGTEEDNDPILQQILQDPGFLYCPKASSTEKELGCESIPAMSGADAVKRKEGSAGTKSPRAGAGRIKDAVRNNHPTVKPVALMAWLVRLVTMSGTENAPPAVVLDPFSGSGSTGIACLKLRAERHYVRYIGMEMNPRFVQIQEARLQYWEKAFQGGTPSLMKKRRVCKE